MSSAEDQQGRPDRRRPFRVWVDVLATPEQMPALQVVISEVLCAAPDDHHGPCRIAWSIASLDSADTTDDGSSGWTPDDVSAAWEHLGPIHVWPEAEVDRSLGL